MKYIDEIYTNTYEIKQSKFIAYLTPYSKYQQTLDMLKIKHSKARHFVIAYRYLNEFDQIIEHSSDDGEPKGTSGKPSLFVLQGASMINCGVIIVRYFGGTKLGTGGLVRAYSDAVNLVLNQANLLEYKKLTKLKIFFEYSNIRKVEYECELIGIDITNKEFDIGTIYELESSSDDIELFLVKLDRLVKVVD